MKQEPLWVQFTKEYHYIQKKFEEMGLYKGMDELIEKERRKNLTLAQGFIDNKKDEK